MLVRTTGLGTIGTVRGLGAIPFAAGLLLVAGCGGETGDPDASASLDFPDPAPIAARAVQPTDFVGAEACADCHTEEYRAWATSTHGEAGGEPGPDVVIAPFDGRAIRFAHGRNRVDVGRQAIHEDDYTVSRSGTYID